MKMRVVCLMVALIVLAVTLSNCETESAEAGSKNPFDGRFAGYRVDDCLYIYVDKGTGVCYLWCDGGSGRGGLTVMFDEDGRPLTYLEDYCEE